jgi:RNA recognition motif-containing protein
MSVKLHGDRTMAIRLFIGNLPQNVTESELRAHFSVVGPISYISLPTDRETGRQRGFAFLEFKDRAQADEAIRCLDNKSFKGNLLSIREARAREDRGSPPAPFLRPAAGPEPETANSAANRTSPNFGPDASPQRDRAKTKGKPHSERGPKGPMREVVRGQFFGDDDGDDDEDPVNPDFDDDKTGEEIVGDWEEHKSEAQFSGLGLTGIQPTSGELNRNL